MSLAPSTRALYPFASHFWQRDGLRLHYLDEGEGDVVVMLHGNPTWSFYWRELVKALRQSHRVIVPDHIGCGLSDKPTDADYSYRLRSRVDDVEGLLEHLGVEGDVTLIAHDWGGMIAAAYALRKPERIRRMVMMNTSVFMLPEGKSLPWRLWLLRMIRPFAAVAVRGFNLFSWSATWMATRKGLPKEVKAGLVAPYDSWANRIAVLRFVQDIPLVPGDASYEDVKFVQENFARSLADVPLMLCWGEHDFVFDMEFLAEWERRCPHAIVHRFADAGHYVMEDAVEEIIPLVRGFLSEDD